MLIVLAFPALVTLSQPHRLEKNGAVYSRSSIHHTYEDNRSFEELCTAASYRLRTGKNFQTAIKEMQIAVSKNPQSSLANSTLGCAFASRAASVSFTATKIPVYMQNEDRYRSEYKRWQSLKLPDMSNPEKSSSEANDESKIDDQNQKKLARILLEWRAYYDEKHPLDPQQPPPAPPQLKTCDDGLPFVFTEKQAQEEFLTLSRLAQDAWSKSVTLASTNEERADRQWIRAYGLLLLFRHAKTLKVTLPIDKQEIINTIHQAIRIMPNSTVYNQTLGDVYLDWYTNISIEDRRSAKDAYESALRLASHDTNLWYHYFYLLQNDKIPEDAVTPRSADALERVCALEHSNGFPLYFKASRLLDKEKRSNNGRIGEVTMRQVVALVNQANQATDCHPIEYQRRIPAQLAPAWSYLGNEDETRQTFPLFLVSLAKTVCASLVNESDANSLAQQEDKVRSAKSVIGIGSCLLRGLPRDVGTWHTKEHLLDNITFEVTKSGYNAMVKIYHAVNDLDTEHRVAAERDTCLADFRQRQKEFMANKFFGYGTYN